METKGDESGKFALDMLVRDQKRYKKGRVRFQITGRKLQTFPGKRGGGMYCLGQESYWSEWRAGKRERTIMGRGNKTKSGWSSLGKG